MSKRSSKIQALASRYAKFVEWSEDDRCFIGRCPGLFHGGIHGDDEAKVIADLRDACEKWVESILGNDAPLPKPTAGTTYSGKFVVRVPPDVHMKIALKAKSRRESINRFVSDLLAKA